MFTLFITVVKMFTLFITTVKLSRCFTFFLCITSNTYHCAHSGKSLAIARCMRLGGFLLFSLLSAVSIKLDLSWFSNNCITSIRPCITQQCMGIKPCNKCIRHIKQQLSSINIQQNLDTSNSLLPTTKFANICNIQSNLRMKSTIGRNRVPRYASVCNNSFCLKFSLQPRLPNLSIPHMNRLYQLNSILVICLNI